MTEAELRALRQRRPDCSSSGSGRPLVPTRSPKGVARRQPPRPWRRPRERSTARHPREGPELTPSGVPSTGISPPG